MKNIVLTLLFFVAIQTINAQKELPKIKKTLLDYIEGTANGEPDRVKKAFHKDLNLYFIKDGELTVWKGTNYTNNIQEGKKSNRIGRIVSIDHEGNAAMAKIEIKMPARKRIYTDYLMLLKIGEEWKIIHKSFTFRSESD
jgi:hypothetical protein